MVAESFAASLKFVEVKGCLLFAPSAQRVFGDTQQVGFCSTRKPKGCHG